MPLGAASLFQVARAEGHLKLSDSMADLAANKVDWWRQNEDNLPHWAGAVKMVLLDPAFFCGCCASLLLTLSRLFRSAAGCIQDYVETSVMLHNNHRRDNNVDVFELTT